MKDIPSSFQYVIMKVEIYKNIERNMINHIKSLDYFCSLLYNDEQVLMILITIVPSVWQKVRIRERCASDYKSA
jgi:hypothetical protein